MFSTIYERPAAIHFYIFMDARELSTKNTSKPPSLPSKLRVIPCTYISPLCSPPKTYRAMHNTTLPYERRNFIVYNPRCVDLQQRTPIYIDIRLYIPEADFIWIAMKILDNTRKESYNKSVILISIKRKLMRSFFSRSVAFLLSNVLQKIIKRKTIGGNAHRQNTRWGSPRQTFNATPYVRQMSRRHPAA